jgi:hypothetical protein
MPKKKAEANVDMNLAASLKIVDAMKPFPRPIDGLIVIMMTMDTLFRQHWPNPEDRLQVVERIADLWRKATALTFEEMKTVVLETKSTTEN